MCLRIYLQPFFTTRWKADGNNSFSSYSTHISSSLKHVAAGTSVLHRHVFFILLLSLCSVIPQDFLFKEVFKYSIFFPKYFYNTFFTVVLLMLELPNYSHCFDIIQRLWTHTRAASSFQSVSESSLPPQEEKGHSKVSKSWSKIYRRCIRTR